MVTEAERAALKAVRPATLRKIVEYLENELGLTVYGPNLDVETLVEYPALRNWGADDIVKLRAIYLRGQEFEEYTT